MTMAHQLTLLKLKRGGIDYSVRVREALFSVEYSLKTMDFDFARVLISNFIFDTKPKISESQEIILVSILLSDFFILTDAVHVKLFYDLIELSNDNTKSFLIKFIIASIQIGSMPALNASALYLSDNSNGHKRRKTNDLGHDLTHEIIFYSYFSLQKLVELPQYSPMMTNLICLITAETFKNEHSLPINLRELIIEWMSHIPMPSLFFTFIAKEHVNLGNFLLCTFCKYIIINELFDADPSYNKLHLRIIECLNNKALTESTKPVMDIQFFIEITNIIKRKIGVKDSRRIENATNKLAQLVQASKSFFVGSPSLLFKKLLELPPTKLLNQVLGDWLHILKR